MSWIHIDDLVNLFISAIENDKFSGIYNAVSSEPVSNRYFLKRLARKKKGRFYIPLPVPAFALRLFLGEMSIELLKSATVSNKKLLNAGFEFRHPTLDSALNELTGIS
jgi:NAD dependent epimerase/dehydratase family enzyme